tara:strand:+ start:1496 stop:2317 length:822 start_codon:yes stop_codon:yes gene_type:complete
MYHRVGDNQYPSTNVSLELFKDQIEYLEKNDYEIDSISNIQDFSEDTSKFKKVYITFDDGFLSVYKNAYPILSEKKFPFSVFISTKFIKENNDNDFMNWDMIKILEDNNVEIYNHGHSHKSFVAMNIDDAKKDILHSKKIIEEKINYKSNVISFPYGETNNEINKFLKDSGYKMAFGQHSGIINKNSNFLNLPRFAINQNYGQMNRFKKILNYSRLTTFDENPLDSIVKIPQFNYSFRSDKPVKRINCFLRNKILKKKNRRSKDKNYGQISQG